MIKVITFVFNDTTWRRRSEFGLVAHFVAHLYFLKTTNVIFIYAIGNKIHSTYILDIITLSHRKFSQAEDKEANATKRS